MSEFETILQECLRDVEQGASNVEECLRRYPVYATQLEPVLLTSAYLALGREAQVSPDFKARVRNRLMKEMYAHPRKQTTRAFSFGFMRLAAGLAILMLALLTAGTAYAQRALPGEVFYSWKLASENAWRMVSPDPIGTDLAIAERRLQELVAVRNDPILQAQTLRAYLQVTDRLRSQTDEANEARVLDVLDSHAEELRELHALPEEPVPNVTPGVIPPVEAPGETSVSTPLPILETPQVNPTELPQVVPTVEVVPEVLPTIQEPPQIIPTIKLPPALP